MESKAHLGNTGDSVWAAAIGSYTGWSSAIVTGSIVDDEIEYSVQFTYDIWDPYDWDINRGGIQGSLANMHLQGLAKQYMMTGKHSMETNWTKGSAPAAPPPTQD
jgi:hypothetical protein